MRQLLVLIAVLGAPACASLSGGNTRSHGEAVAITNCANCHAVGASGESTAPEAPAFRGLEAAGYRTATLETALLNGISAGHPAMPTLKLSKRDVRALVAYLQAVQSQR
jgi:mono/diheme cytochrome c family protein